MAALLHVSNRSETSLLRAAEAAGSAPVSSYECSAELHAEAVGRWRAAHHRHNLLVAPMLVAAFGLIVLIVSG